MDGLIVSIPLKGKHARTFVVGRIILHDNRGGESGQDVVDEKIIVCQLVVPMIRDLHLPSGDQLTNPLKRSTHRTSKQDTTLLSEPPSYMRYPIYSRPFDLISLARGGAEGVQTEGFEKPDFGL
jgi:hypothetical protein